MLWDGAPTSEDRDAEAVAKALMEDMSLWQWLLLLFGPSIAAIGITGWLI